MTNLREQLAPKGSAARPGYGLTPQYITIHNTANAGKGAGADAHGRYLQGAGAQKTVSYHYAVDDGLIVRIIPDSEVAWHAGDGARGTGNRRSLAIEICENPESDLAKATDNAAELTAHLLQQYAIPLENVVQHHHWTGKNCPHLLRAGRPYGWDAFLAKVRGYRDVLDAPDPAAPAGPLWTVQTGAFSQKENAAAYCAALADQGIPSWARLTGRLYRVQCGAFASRDNAQRYADKLTARGVGAYVCRREV